MNEPEILKKFDDSFAINRKTVVDPEPAILAKFNDSRPVYHSKAHLDAMLAQFDKQKHGGEMLPELNTVV